MREWQAYFRLTWSEEEKADYRAKYLALHVAGDPEITIDAHRMPWDPDPDAD